ncbi:hypothetical protein BG011_002203, partial [Mortierella polycephala]
MEAACANVIGSTILLNCIWHLGHQNLNRNLHGALGKDWEAFISSFWATRNAITEHEFERKWSEKVVFFGNGKPKVQSYLERIFERREHWAWPWVGTRFTAGMQSTQRVEGVNAIIKKAVHSKTSLPSLFQSIERMVSDEARSSRYLHYKMDMVVDPPRTDFVKQMFSEVIEVNSRFLGIAAKNQMTMEMTRSVYYRSNLHVPEEAQIQQGNEIGVYDGYPFRKPDMDGCNEEIEKSSREDCLKVSLESMSAIVGSSRIECVLMQVDSRCKYHITLIPKRWYKEELQDMTDLESSSVPFLRAKTQKVHLDEGVTVDTPAASYMSDVKNAFPLAPTLSRDDQGLLSKKRRYGEISGLMKDLIRVVDSNPENFEMVKEAINQVIVKGKGDAGVQDPAYVKAK